jgi:O-antigen/teichoic acid export membrane protein
MQASYDKMFRSLLVIGGASVVSVLVGLLKTKVVALILGPLGVGQIGLYQSLMATAAAVFGVGTSTAGTRRVAETRHQPRKIDLVRAALQWGTAILALMGAIVTFALRQRVSVHLFGDASHSTDIGWVALGVAMTIAAGSQTALLNGLERLGDLARITVISSVAAAVAGVAIVVAFEHAGAVFFVLAAPAAALACGHWYVRAIPRTAGEAPEGGILHEWGTLSKLGAAFMVSGLAGSMAQLLVRTMVSNQLGANALGQFQAAWTIGITYIGFILTAMGANFYPRLTASIGDRRLACQLVNQQTEVALLVSGPVCLLAMGFTPQIVHLLYSEQFTDAALLLRWQIIGDIFKLASWPLGFVLLATGGGRNFLFAELCVNVVFVLITWAAIPYFGLHATAHGFVCMYVLLLPIVYFFGRSVILFRWELPVVERFLVLVAWALLVLVCSYWSEPFAAVAAAAGALAFGIEGLGRLGQMILLPPRLARLSAACRKIRPTGRRRQN